MICTIGAETATLADVQEDFMTQGLLIVGLLFGLGFLMIVGVHSALRDLLSRPLHPRHFYEDEDSSGALAEETGPIRLADAIARDLRA
jgi:hypothetical protein